MIQGNGNQSLPALLEAPEVKEKERDTERKKGSRRLFA